MAWLLLPLPTIMISLISSAFSNHVDSQYSMFSTEIWLMAMIHNILLMLPQEWHIENLGPYCCLRQSWSKCYMLLQWSSWKSDLNCIVKLCWNNWWLFTSPKQPCWCPNGDLVMPMIPVANWDPGEFHGQ